MELPRRTADDVYLAEGAYARLVEELRAATWTHDWSSVIAYPFDRRTRLMPFRWTDKRVVPCGVRSVAASMLECGFERTRVVLQQWNPKFSPSAAVAAGHKTDLLMISSMGLHANEAYRMIRDAHALGEQRPLILIGGPKAIYEPEDCFAISPELVGDGVDVAVTGEVYVLLELLKVLADQKGAADTLLAAFQRARRRGLLDSIPGLVYRAAESEVDKPYLINTGVQRLLKDFDELPMPLPGYTCLEPAHRRRRTLSPHPWSLKSVRRKTFISTLDVTHGCRFNCDFCPIPAYQQRTWRHKSPERVADEIKQLAEKMHYRVFFGTDDNFFNDRQSTEAILSAMACSKVHGRSFREMVHFATEATEFDVYKNRDLLPLAHQAGLKTVFFGIEDLNAQLINKGQTLDKTKFLFQEMRKNELAAYAMMIHHDDQPLFSREPGRLGVVNQAHRLFQIGAAGYHTTYITPSMGARNVETMFSSGVVFSKIGATPVPEAFFDGNHVVATRHRRAWIRQVQLWLAYFSFYNPLNFARTLLQDLTDRHLRRRFKWQLLGSVMVPISILKTLPYTLALALRTVTKHQGTPRRCLPMVDAHTGERVKWGIDSDAPYPVRHAAKNQRTASSEGSKRRNAPTNNLASSNVTETNAVPTPKMNR